ncbi:50S ribosomal protein L10 [Candidatus Woesebacteria bacterium RIFCSPHIGHO2_01_FULL_37_10]|uniref:Large ribosomal subunit protein uL10 n=1 Tax=Candidatus Woesebacteria bacterium RIFCSPHIGHO2_01_FULL_37_10 TaxID=1802489 RepID=A0A1F7XWD2_9BACT|nr:MAG: 50S ribosomal protein L10 [Candidatus Woesebacteria bacterium RIFCSPHIGHO2_01_FULL_37_10]
MKKSEKPFYVENLSGQLKSATSVVLVDYSGLSVKKQQELKKRLKEVGAGMYIVKNRLFKLAGTSAKINDETLTDKVLSGPTALVITEADPIAPLQILGKFAKEFEIPQLKVGIVEGRLQDKEHLTRLSILPSKEVLYAQVLGGLSSPMYGIVSVLQGNLQKLVFILNEKVKGER